MSSSRIPRFYETDRFKRYRPILTNDNGSSSLYTFYRNEEDDIDIMGKKERAEFERAMLANKVFHKGRNALALGALGAGIGLLVKHVRNRRRKRREQKEKEKENKRSSYGKHGEMRIQI